MDISILLWLQENIRSDFLTPFFKGITALGNIGWFWILLTFLLIYLKKTRKVGLACLASLVFSFLFNNLLIKGLVQRPRPFEISTAIQPLIPYPIDSSFPSGHSAASFACATVLFLCFPKKYSIFALVLATLIAYSRLYLGVHFLTDILFGMISGIIIGAFCSDFVKD